MKIRIWGARGSIPAPLKPEEVEEKICRAILGLPDIDTDSLEAIRAYVKKLPPLLRGTAGSNTSCVEIQAEGKTFIVDAGTGLRELGLELMKGPCGRGQGTLHLFISHPHWDHIQGFPFFVPAFIPSNHIFFYGIHDLKAVFEDQQRPLNFPVPLSAMQAKIEFISLQAGQPFSIGQVRIKTIQNAHPGNSYSYRFEDQHSVFVYASDAEYKQLDDAGVQSYIEFFKGADALIFDTQYTLREGWLKEDWGHSSAMIGTDLARAAGVKQLILFHHEPTYSDADLQKIQADAIAYQDQDTTLPTCEVIVAYEGLTLDLTPPGAVALQFTPDGEAAILAPTSVFDERGVDQLAQQLAHLADQDSPVSPIIDLSQVERLTTASLKLLIKLRRKEESARIVLAAPSDSVRQVIKLGGYSDYFAIYPSVEAALDAVQIREALNLPGQVIKDRYQIEDRVAEGWLGTVLKATDTHLNRTVALKILSPTFSEETVTRFMRQAGQVIALDHRNIVQAFDWDEDRGHSFMVEELMGGRMLHDLLADSDTPLPADQVLDIALDIARALEYAHSRGVILGDLKPRNVFLTDEGAKLSGFGLGRLEEGRNLLDAPLLFLTPAYLAPEQILGQVLDARTDLYALGVILYQSFTGRPPFEGPDQEVMQAHLRQAPRPPRELNPHISVSLEHLILKLLAQNPNDRYASAGQVRRILSSLIVGAEDVTRQRWQLLVGREKPMRALRACWEEARAGRGQLAFITGEPGIGKTSLAQQVAARSHPPVLLIGRCLKLEGSPAYHLFTEVLRTYFATVPPEFLDEEARQLLANFIRLVPEIRQMLPDLLEPPPLEPEQEQLRLMTSLTQFIKRATQERPWLLILDDLQWADQSSLELLRHLGRHLPSMALLIIGTYRDVEVEQGHPLLETLRDLSSHPTYRHFPLDRLDQADVGQVLANIWQPPVPAALTEKIHRHTGGNPFYVEEVAQGLVDDGLITLQEGRWHFPVLEEVRLPESVHEVVWRRIGHLSSDTQALLRQAAVLGQTFKFDDLREMSGLSEWEALEHLGLALERGLVQEVPGDTMLRFRHIEIQSVLYADLGPLHRRLLHRQAGEALERRAQPEPERFAEQLAHHFGEAGEFERAVSYSIQAARQAQTAYANDAALLWYNRTLEMLDQLGPEEASQFQSLRLAVYQSLGEVLQLVGQWTEAGDLFQQALDLAEQLGDRSAQAWCQTAMGELLGWKQGQYAEASVWLEQARAGFEELDDQAGIGQVLKIWGTLAAQQGDYEAARARYEESLAIQRELEDKPQIAALLNNLGIVARRQGDYEAAQALHEEALELRYELGDKWAIANSLNNLGNVLADQGDYPTARARLEEAVGLQREIGDRYSIAIALHSLANVTRDQGDYEAARARYEESLVIQRELGERFYLAQVLEDMGGLAAVQGQPERALRLSGAAEALRETTGAPLSPAAQGKLERMLAPARQALGEAATASAVAEGRAMSLEQAIDYAFQAD